VRQVAAKKKPATESGLKSISLEEIEETGAMMLHSDI
jgi:hypothetical protein